MKNILIILSILFLSCKGTSQKKLESNTTEKKEDKNIFKRVETINSFQDNSLFTFSDTSSLFIEQFDSNQYIKLSNKMIFLSNSFLESANTICYLYKNNDEKILIVEGNDYYAGIFYVYYFDKENLYEIGTFYVDYPNIEVDRKSEEVDFKVEKQSNKIFIRVLKNNRFQKEESFIISDKEKLKKFESEKEFINYLMQENVLTPENIINHLTFTKDKNDSLKINTEILDYISKNTNRENSTYLFALENYVQKNREDLGWSHEEFAKIKGFVFNTTYLLRKKYWNDKFDEWYGEKPEKLLGSGSYWQENNYYGLPKLEEYVRDFIITHHWTQY
ncbi:hypothetical protein [Empedobacter tilapiae]